VSGLAGTIQSVRARHKEPQLMMNLNLAHSLLVAAEKQPWGFLNVRGADMVHEVELMASAGLVDASLGNADIGAFAVINRVTTQGHAFLRAFENQPPPKMETARALESAEH
jgi:hypothetical protein